MPHLATSRGNKAMFSAENRTFISPICAVCAAPAKAETRKDTEGKPALQHQCQDSLRSSQEADCRRSEYSWQRSDAVDSWPKPESCVSTPICTWNGGIAENPHFEAQRAENLPNPDRTRHFGRPKCRVHGCPPRVWTTLQGRRRIGGFIESLSIDVAEFTCCPRPL